MLNPEILKIKNKNLTDPKLLNGSVLSVNNQINYTTIIHINHIR